MSSAPDRHGNDHRMSSKPGRRRGKVLIPVAFVAAIVLVMLFIWLVSYLGR